jgi:hypothetical protein
MHFATALEHDVEIEIRPHAAAEDAARVWWWGRRRAGASGRVDGRQRSGLRSMPTHRKERDEWGTSSTFGLYFHKSLRLLFSFVVVCVCPLTTGNLGEWGLG